MTGGPGRKRPHALTCPTCGGAMRQTAEEGLLCFTCHLDHRFGAADMDAAQFHQTEQVLRMALRMFKERAELARRLATEGHKRGRPVSADTWEATVREMEEAAEVLRSLLGRSKRRSGPEGDEGNVTEST